jgi:hypothetical protein
MNKLNILLMCFFIGLSFKTSAQEDAPFKPDASYSDGRNHREVIVNMTPLVSQFVPFNASTISKFNLYDYEYRRLRNGRGWRWSLGATVGNQLNIDDPNSIYLRIGLIRRRQIASRIHFTRSWDFNATAESLGNNGQPIGKIGFSGFGLAYAPGIEFSINSRLSLSTEGSFFLGLLPLANNEDLVVLKFIPPVGLFFHVKF